MADRSLFSFQKKSSFFLQKTSVFLKKDKENGSFQLLFLERSWAQPLTGRICHVALKNKPNILSLVHRRLPCLSAAKLMRLAHTQGRDELPSEILQPLRGSNSRASLAFSALQPHFAGIVKRRSESENKFNDVCLTFNIFSYGQQFQFFQSCKRC